VIDKIVNKQGVDDIEKRLVFWRESFQYWDLVK